VQPTRSVSIALVTFSVALGTLLALLESCTSDKAAESKSVPAAATVATPRPAKPFFRPSGTGPAVWGPGDLYTFLATGDETNGAYFQFEALVPPGGGPPPHIHHAEAESFYLVEGQLQLRLGDSLVTATSGDFVSIPKETTHSFKNIGTGTTKMLVTFVPAGMEKYFVEVFAKAEDRTAAPPPVTHELIEKMTAAAPKYNLEILPPPAPE
jgi:mannose-6-phosphate isomerase-like protein (cupin superfamily)